MRSSLGERDRRHRQRERELDGELEPRRYAERSDLELAAVVCEAEQAAGDQSADGGERARMAGDRGEQPTDDSQRSE